ncbi:MAG: IS630 family transposase [Pseudomonadota bacterium]
MSRIEDVLDVYEEDYNEKRPVICMDESTKQLLQDVREPLPTRPASPAKEDYAYKRNGTANLFVACESQIGQRHISVTAQHNTAVDFAYFMQGIERCYAQADIIRVVLDNLRTHGAKSFYEAFEPEEARRLAKRFELHYTPKHGSWLNMAEIELASLNKRCLNRRIPDEATLKREVGVYEWGT